MNAKSFLASKTIWIQIITIAATLIPAVGTWVAANPVGAAGALGAVNILVRFATSGKVTLFSDDTAGSGGGSLPLGLLLAGVSALLMGGGLTSCATSVAPDGTKTTKPDVESISLAQSIAEWGVGLWRGAAPPVADPAAVEPTVTPEK